VVVSRRTVVIGFLKSRLRHFLNSLTLLSVFWGNTYKDISKFYYVPTPTDNTLFGEMCDLYMTDKGGERDKFDWSTHTYSEIYEKLFAFSRNEAIRILEIGIGSSDQSIPSNMTNAGSPGASLRTWARYFPNSQVFGLDIDEKCMFAESRISTAVADQLNQKSIRLAVDGFGYEETPVSAGLGSSDTAHARRRFLFDLIIDDGLHSLEAARSAFEACFELLSSRGIYIIEDVSFKYLRPLLDFLLTQSFGTDLQVSLFVARQPQAILGNNNLVCVRSRIRV
jgi:hypothetical protein